MHYCIKILCVWDLTLSAGDRDGRKIAVVKKGFFVRNFDITLCETNFRTTLFHSGFWGRTFRFTGATGTPYKWHTASVWLMSDFVCFHESNDNIVARWRNTWTSLMKRKEGQIFIMPNYCQEAQLILTSSLTVEEWARREIRGRGASGGGGP